MVASAREDLLTQLGISIPASSTSRPETWARPAPRRYDIEAWFPQERYREVTPGLEHDRLPGPRLGMPLAAADAGLETPHTLNGTVLTDRALLAILENFQGEVPDVCRSSAPPPASPRSCGFPAWGGALSPMRAPFVPRRWW